MAACLLALALAACTRPAPERPEVRLYASPGLPGDVIRTAAGRLGVARVALVARPEEAELAWLADPVAALALGDRVEPGSAPETPGVNPRWTDRQRRFAPAGARAQVLVVAPNAALPVAPASLGHLVDGRLAGKVAIVHPGKGAGPVVVAAVAAAYGDAAARRWLQRLAANRPLVAGSDEEVRRAVASGQAAVGLTSSVEGAAGAMSRAGLSVVYPDQTGKGTPVLPTAVVLFRGAGEDARRLAGWLTSRDGEAVLVARVPGILPLRPEVPIPLGVELAENVSAPALDWDRLAAKAAELAPALGRWPEGF